MRLPRSLAFPISDSGKQTAKFGEVGPYAIPRQSGPPGAQLKCLDTNFVISNILTNAFPPHTSFRAASALIIILLDLS